MRGHLAVGLAMLLSTCGAAMAQAATTERVSVDSSEGQADTFAALPTVTRGSFEPSISDDGEIVTFGSNATDLVVGDTNGVFDVFVRNRAAGLTERISVASSGAQGNDGSGGGHVSGNGRFVAFESGASNLVPGDTNGANDIFVRDLSTATTERISLDADDRQLPGGASEAAISDDGRFVAFRGVGAHPNHVFVRDRSAGTTELVSVAPPGTTFIDCFSPTISGDGRFVGFGAFVNATDSKVFVHDRATGKTEEIAETNSGAVSLNRDGRFVAYNLSIGLGLPLIVRDRLSGATEQIATGAFDSVISPDGRFVSFTEAAIGQPGPQGVLLHDRLTGTTERVSVNAAGQPAGDGSFNSDVSAGGRVVAFESAASNLIAGDTNDVEDVFVRDRAPSIPDQLAALRDRIRGFGLPHGSEHSLLAKVAPRCGSLRALIRHANAQLGNELTPDQAFQVIAEAGRIKDALGCA